MTTSATPPTGPQVEPIKFFLLYCLNIKNGGRTGFVVLGILRYKVPLFLILLWNQVSRKTKLRIVTKKQLNGKVVIVVKIIMTMYAVEWTIIIG